MLVPVTKCDGCNAEIDVTVITSSLDVTLGDGSKARHHEGELCDDCRDTLAKYLGEIANLLPVIKPKSGRPPKDTYSTKKAHQVSADDDFSDIPVEIFGKMSSSPDLPFRYRECTLCGTVCSTRMELSSHAKKVHGGSITLVARRLPSRLEVAALKETE